MLEYAAIWVSSESQVNSFHFVPSEVEWEHTVLNKL